jgi:hypothetical protein
MIGARIGITVSCKGGIASQIKFKAANGNAIIQRCKLRPQNCSEATTGLVPVRAFQQHQQLTLD